MAQTHTLAVALGATYAGLTLRIQMADVLTGAAVNFASVGSSSGSAAWRTDADDDTWIVEGVDGTYTVRCTAWPDAGSLPVRVDVYNATGPVLLASGLLAQEDVDVDGAVLASIAALNNLSAPQVWAAITATAANIIADHVIRRKVANALASANGDAIDDAASLYGVIMRGHHADTTTNPGFLTVFDSDGNELEQIALTPDAAAEPTVAIG